MVVSHSYCQNTMYHERPPQTQFIILNVKQMTYELDE